MASRHVTPPGSPTNEARFVERLRNGDEQALDELLGLHWSPLVRYASVMLGSADLAEDVVQRAFLDLWARRESWSAETSFRHMLFRITRNLALNERRHQRVRRRWFERQARQPEPSPATPLDEMLGDELRRAVQAAIDALPERRREVFLLARFQGLSYQEIADVLEISPQTVANQMSAALTALRRALEPLR